MATASGKKTTRSKGKTSTNRATKQAANNRRKNTQNRESVDSAVTNEVILIGIFAAAIFLFLCNINVVRGDVGEFIKSILFGLFGVLAYIIPIICFVATAFGMSNKGNTIATLKLIAMVVFLFLLGMVATLLTGQIKEVDTLHVLSSFYAISNRGLLSGGGVVFGGLTYFIYSHIGIGGTIFFVLVFGIISVVVLTEKSFLNSVKKGGHFVYENTSESINRRRKHREEYESFDETDYSEDEEHTEETKEEPVKKLRMEKKARGVMADTSIVNEEKVEHPIAKDDIHEIIWKDEESTTVEDEQMTEDNPFTVNGLDNLDQFERINIRSVQERPLAYRNNLNDSVKIDDEYYEDEVSSDSLESDDMNSNTFEQEMSIENDANSYHDEPIEEVDLTGMPEPVTEHTTRPDRNVIAEEKPKVSHVAEKPSESVHIAETPTKREYQFPPLSLLKRGDKKANGDSSQELKQTAYHLQQTLKTFGVNVTITDISQGPSVTRFELQPEQGVKVSKIVGLADDIKLNLAATDIRIEAPIPGKAAVGIEVPNKENSAVALRDLLESKEFKQFPSNIAFAVGKDIGGQVVVTDIAKMPHMLIAGATGSGKSVCINTIIMGILYKAKPEDVKLIMIDPKVVELSVYNGIPHLMIPVVTDPKKAAAALQWGVSEMTDRYKKFAEMNVRDLKGYNKAVERGMMDANGQPMKKMPQLVIIVDELADLMMVASNDVEEAICRLAQLARAAGIHLIIATQRPSVDVITGLIKANMPSRVAFSVSSGTDSRTILDMNGAEKLLGRGDMLFYPQGYSKPARIQGAFVSDAEVSDVVDCIKNQALGNSYAEGLDEQINNMKSAGGAGGRGEVDPYFAEAGKFVIDKDKASIGMLQRVFKIGFNRAARIVDQLEEAGVVGAEEGTKPRRVLMSMSEFENYIEETL